MDYAGMRLAANADIQSAQAVTGEQKMTLRDSDHPRTVPSGSQVRVTPTSFMKLRPGEYVLVRGNSGIAVRRYVHACVTKESTRLVMATESATEEVGVGSLLGRVAEVSHQGKSFDPNPSGWFSSMANRLTYCGTRRLF
ncbi:MAG: hypothetical protein KC910_06505 [Candidatus Eremiobacteraeota bacterium]|nr:hypothetical protein [Candidatus Eremiobacteraeota bacterium]